MFPGEGWRCVLGLGEEDRLLFPCVVGSTEQVAEGGEQGPICSYNLATKSHFTWTEPRTRHAVTEGSPWMLRIHTGLELPCGPPVPGCPLPCGPMEIRAHCQCRVLVCRLPLSQPESHRWSRGSSRMPGTSHQSNAAGSWKAGSGRRLSLGPRLSWGFHAPSTNQHP